MENGQVMRGDSFACNFQFIYADKWEQPNAPLGSTVNITFGGTPPYEMRRVVFRSEIGGWNCGPPYTTLNESWFEWQVESFQEEGDIREYGIEGNAVMFLAVQRNGTGTEEGPLLFNSANYTITAEGSESSAVPIVGGTRGPLLAGVMVAALMILPTLLS